MISNNTQRLGKNLWTKDQAGEAITLYAAFNENDEARFIVDNIEKYYFKNEHSFNSMAILYRSNAQSRALEEQLIKREIPYKIYAGTRFFERAEIKDTLAYLRLLINPDDDLSFLRVVNLPARGIGNTTLEKLRECAEENNISLLKAAKIINIKKLSSFITLTEKNIEETKGLILHEQINHILETTDLKNHFSKDKTEKGLSKLENLHELINAAREFDSEYENKDSDPFSTLQAFLSHVALEAEKHEQNENAVQLMTLHAAKGLEFPIVFLSGMEIGLFPHNSSLSDMDRLEEERRLCYVGMTRAMKKLYLTYSQVRRLYGAETYRRPSVFLDEIPTNLIDGIQHKYNAPVSLINNKTMQNTVINDTGLKIGQKVEHKKFGSGYIINFEGSGEHARIQVKFDHAGTKWLVATYVKLE